MSQRPRAFAGNLSGLRFVIVTLSRHAGTALAKKKLEANTLLVLSKNPLTFFEFPRPVSTCPAK